MEYCRGDIYYVAQGEHKAIGCEMHPGRPAIIVSTDYANERGDNVSVVYLTTAEKRPMRVHVDVMCKVPSTALCESITTVDKSRLHSYVRSCTDEEMQRIDEGIMQALGLSGYVFEKNKFEALLEAEKGNVLVLRKNLKEAEATIKARGDRITELNKEKKAMEDALEDAEENKRAANVDIKIMLCTAQTERDVYKRLFEQLQAQMMERMA